jgi:hypothetical protein
MYVLVGDRNSGVLGYAWRVWASRTSFYLKARYTPLSDWKISLHGPDVRHPGQDGFKLEVDDRATPAARAAGGGWLLTAEMKRRWFAGREVAPGVRHVLRLRSDFTLFQPGVPSGPNPGEIATSAFGGVIRPPAPLCAADVDFYVSTGAPYWAGGARSKRENARLGPLVNESGQVLTAVSKQQLMLNHPTPSKLFDAPRPQGTGDTVRGIGMTIDEDDVLWVREMLLSRKALAAASETRSGATD